MGMRESNMNRIRFYLAGLAAFLVGVPLTEKAMAQTGGIIFSSIDLAAAIASSSDGVS